MARRTSSPRPPAPAKSSPGSAITYTSLAILGGVFMLGIGVGIGFTSVANTDPSNVASREVIDRAAPNAEVCIQYGASAIAMDTRVFVTLNPFNVYVSQPKMQPACVLRQNNWAILEQRKLITSDQVRDCKNRMNTFAFTGALESEPQINCIYQNDAAQNLFLNQPGMSGPPPTGTQQF
ncbi:MAG: DUF3172 domain-containing protein [Leptolyngbyaceae cyanobacterium bins.59]|nr:DUF3172 domain-containing protein [Leptolyngbyaceae cyanobacterium bins.59]